MSRNVLRLQRKSCALAGVLMYAAATRPAGATVVDLKGLEDAAHAILRELKPVDDLLRSQIDTLGAMRAEIFEKLETANNRLSSANDSLGRMGASLVRANDVLNGSKTALDSMVTLLSRTCPITATSTTQACAVQPAPRPKLRLFWGLIELR